MTRPVIGISACLLGQSVRFNGGHARNDMVAEHILPHIQAHPICPEMGMGLSAPRESMRLVQQDNGEVQLLGTKSNSNFQPNWDAYRDVLLSWLQEQDLDGMIVKKKSPTCGLERVALYRTNGYRLPNTQGLMVQLIKSWDPTLPIEEEGRLEDRNLREHFLEQIFFRRKWKVARRAMKGIGDLVTFHSKHKMLYLAHNRQAYDRLGQIVAKAKSNWPNSLDQYEEAAFSCLVTPTTPGKQINVMQHLLGMVKRKLDREDKRELLSLMEGYRKRTAPLSLPLTLLHHHHRKHPSAWSLSQSYWAPFPEAFPVRNLV